MRGRVILRPASLSSWDSTAMVKNVFAGYTSAQYPHLSLNWKDQDYIDYIDYTIDYTIDCTIDYTID
jgi:ribose 1,5-bisphosphokinase PhnN